MKQVTKLKIALTIAPSLFWIIVAVLYLTENKELTTSAVFQLIGWYYFLGIIFEYPTGIIGDYYSHKLSIFLGYAVCIIALIWLLFTTGYWGVFIFYLFYALGASLIMGSDWALLHTLSNNFKEDLSDLKIWSSLMRAFEMVMAGILTKAFGLEVAIYITIMAFVAGGILLLQIKVGNKKIKNNNKEQKRRKGRFIKSAINEGGNILRLARQGVDKVVNTKQLLVILLLGALVSSFSMLLKWLLNPLFLFSEIDLQWWGIIGGISLLFVSFGAWIYKKNEWKNQFILLIIFSGSIFLLGIKPAVLFGLVVFQIFRGIWTTKLTVELNKLINDKERASIMSLKSVVRKIAISGLASLVGALLGILNFPWTVFVLAIIMFTGGGSLLFFITKK